MSLEAPQSKNYEHEKLLVKMTIQTTLVKRYAGIEEPKEEDVFDWINKFSAKFRDLFSQKIIDEPNFLEDFESEKDKYILYFEELLKK